MPDRVDPQLLQTLERFTRSEVEPRAAEFDADPLHPGLADLLSRARGLGLFSLLAPGEEGGVGLPGFAAAVREVARGCAGVAALLMVHNAGAAALSSGAEGLLAPVLPGPMEADAGGGLRGTARFVPGGLRADGFIVLARRLDGMAGCFRVPARDPGLRRRPLPGQSGLRACAAAEVAFDRVRGEALAAGDVAVSVQETLLRDLCIGTSGIALGIADAVHAAASRYAAERHQGGIPIRDHQAVALLLAQMRVETEAASALLREACETPSGDLPRMAKIASTEAAMKASIDAVQILGGYGYMRDYGLEKRMRDAACLLSYPVVNQEALLGLAGPRARL